MKKLLALAALCLALLLALPALAEAAPEVEPVVAEEEEFALAPADDLAEPDAEAPETPAETPEAAQPAETACAHLNAYWIVEDVEYRREDEKVHEVMPQISPEMYCPDCGRSVGRDDLDGDLMKEIFAPMIEEARRALEEVRALPYSQQSGDTMRLESELRNLISTYENPNSELFGQWVYDTSRIEARESSYEEHRFNAEGKCELCGFDPWLGKRVVSGSESLKMNQRDSIVIALKGATPKSWKASPSGIVKLDNTGRITALKEGKTKITITLTNKKKWVLTVTVVNPNKPEGIQIYEKSPVEVTMDGPRRLTALLIPSTAITDLTWKSSNKKVAKVDQDGCVTPVKEGSCTITVTTSNKHKWSVKVKVTDPHKPTGVKLTNGSSATMKVGEKLALNADVTPYGATGKLTWKSSSSKVVSVSADGVVTAKKAGTAKITVTTRTGKKATIKITVKK